MVIMQVGSQFYNITYKVTRAIALMIQLGRVPGGWGEWLGWVGWVGDIPTTYIHLAGAGSKRKCVTFVFRSELEHL